jgi:predicted Zn finger-like uncharacterized protein
MFTQCPKCHTVFRLSAHQLRMAQGLVRCGTCHIVFDCVQTLRDEPPQGSDSRGSRLPEEDSSSEVLDLDVLAADADALSENGAARPTSPGLRAAETGPSSPALGTVKPAERAKPAGPRSVARDPVPPMETAAQPSRENGPKATAPSRPGKLTLDDPVTRLLREVEEEVRPRNRMVTLAWGVGVILLSALLVLQYAYFARENLAERAHLRPWLQSMCRLFACTIPARRDPGAIRIIARELREHPSLPDALSVRVSFVNGAPFAQVFPLLLVRLLRTDGSLVAGRAFRPQEYLRQPPDTPELLQPQESAYAELTLESPGLDASGFELEFL